MKEKLIEMLAAQGKDLELLLQNSEKIKLEHVGNKVFLRGLIEISNHCSKNCYYCGIRKGNAKNSRYFLSDDEILNAARYAFEHRFGSIVLQGGELESVKHTQKITGILRKIRAEFGTDLGITLSLGEQNKETLLEWKDAGAHRYLLRIETSNSDLYYKIHPEDNAHSFDKRIESIELLKECGYQTGSGVMIGLPFQTLGNLADDLLFFKKTDIDMCGMGPYIEHEDTPLYQYRHLLLSKEERFTLALKMIAALRHLMPDINIAATTAMQSLHPQGRSLALKYGANIAMPNLTPTVYRESYLLYENKPGVADDSIQAHHKFEKEVESINGVIGYNEWGDSRHFQIKIVSLPSN